MARLRWCTTHNRSSVNIVFFNQEAGGRGGRQAAGAGGRRQGQEQEAGGTV